MERPTNDKTWQARNELQKLIDGACLCDRDSRGKAIPWKDASGSGASVALLKAVLNALLTFYPNMHPSEELLAARTGKAVRTVQRAIQVLQGREILLVEESDQARRGGRFNRYVLSASRLRQLNVQQGTLWNQKTTRHAGATTRHREHDHPPCGARPPATHGALTINPRQREDQTQEGGAGARVVWGEGEKQEALRQAYRVREAIGRPLSQEQADEVIQVCLWRLRGRLAEHSFEVSLEATRKARPRDPFAYWKTCIGNQLKGVSHA